MHSNQCYRTHEQNSEGHVFSIPMPGHFIHEKEATAKDILQLEALIQSHDVVFLLTDSRESRWLPTLLGAYHNKVNLPIDLQKKK